MSSPEDNVPETIIPVPGGEQTGEVVLLPPEQAQEVIDEIKAVAESRGEDSEVVELIDLPQTGPLPTLTTTAAAPAQDDDELQIDELRDAWPLLDLDERGDGLRVLPREDAEEFFIQLTARDQAQLLI